MTLSKTSGLLDRLMTASNVYFLPKLRFQITHPHDRRQMMQFCGQMPFCTAFNSRQAMEEAKKNVEVGYQVARVIIIIKIIIIIVFKIIIIIWR